YFFSLSADGGYFEARIYGNLSSADCFLLSQFYPYFISVIAFPIKL
ncbi:MAG: hypothetical protein UW52_C0045G0001, partial [Candidatus Gottesmanbacteria bacterium GW2011_GWA1_44_24b]